MGRMVGAFALLLLGPMVLLLFTSQVLAILFTFALLGGLGLVGFTIGHVTRAYVRWVRRRTRRSPGRGPVRRGLTIAAWLVAGAIAGVILLPAYLVTSAVGGMLDGGASPRGGGSTGLIPLSGFVAVAVVVLLVFVAPVVGLAYVGLSAGLFWLHRAKLRIPGRPPTVGIGGLIDWLDHQARSTT